jgi:hypothetical protein
VDPVPGHRPDVVGHGAMTPRVFIQEASGWKPAPLQRAMDTTSAEWNEPGRERLPQDSGGRDDQPLSWERSVAGHPPRATTWGKRRNTAARYVATGLRRELLR